MCKTAILNFESMFTYEKLSSYLEPASCMTFIQKKDVVIQQHLRFEFVCNFLSADGTKSNSILQIQLQTCDCL